MNSANDILTALASSISKLSEIRYLAYLQAETLGSFYEHVATMQKIIAKADALCVEVSLIVDRNVGEHDCIVDYKDIAALRASRDAYRESGLS